MDVRVPEVSALPTSSGKDKVVLKFSAGVFDHEILDLKKVWLPNSLRKEEVIFDLHKI